ncbi:HNH endonuclease [Capnocytophaga sp. Marseille-Q4570]|jgi:bacteriophage lambda ninG protein|uniref:HNH endonuclease n=1 Tax=Capnocytophaga bilenii TaxID=2819369 RepID=A0ABS3PVN9_9FLAO|nr:HNH endonuclease [Capnocytophaga bilenii]MBO1883386.1 HNH endonuclease [Capnocytophaga bilenii]
MIKVFKKTTSPESLSVQKKYDSEEVKQQLIADHQGKCYLCERVLTTDFQVEHLHSQEHFPEEKYDWHNLFLSCSYCNGKKSNLFDNILNPAQEPIESLITQELDYLNKKAVFKQVGISASTEVQQTLSLLERIFNGTHKMRKTKEERFFEDFLSKMNVFQKAINNFLIADNEQTRLVLQEELTINREFLGFKYWIIQNNPKLLREFAQDIIWNKNS